MIRFELKKWLLRGNVVSIVVALIKNKNIKWI
jgi:hypothetical protein